jgi:hypothetical protein
VGGRLLVVRVELVGQTPLNHELRRGQNQIKASLQATAVTHGHDQVWLEDLKLHTATPDDRTNLADMEGPLESLAAVIAGLRSSPDVGEAIEHELRSLLKKLPAELSGHDSVLPADRPEWVADLIESASSEVLGRLHGSNSSPSNGSPATNP